MGRLLPSLSFILLPVLLVQAQLRVHSTSDFDVTGEGVDSAWTRCEWVELEKRAGSQSYDTRVKLLYSGKGIYVHFHCEDRHITATNTEDFTDLWKEDVFEIFFWTDESTPLYFEYEISPLNMELAILVPNFNGEFLGWKPWQYEGERKTRHHVQIEKSEEGDITAWKGEVFIPYALLRPLQNVPPEKGTKWRMNIYRIDYDEGRTSWSWKMVRTNFHDFKRFGTILFD